LCSDACAFESLDDFEHDLRARHRHGFARRDDLDADAVSSLEKRSPSVDRVLGAYQLAHAACDHRVDHRAVSDTARHRFRVRDLDDTAWVQTWNAGTEVKLQVREPGTSRRTPDHPSRADSASGNDAPDEYTPIDVGHGSYTPAGSK
jgi:hypothetical protein